MGVVEIRRKMGIALVLLLAIYDLVSFSIGEEVLLEYFGPSGLQIYNLVTLIGIPIILLSVGAWVCTDNWFKPTLRPLYTYIYNSLKKDWKSTVSYFSLRKIKSGKLMGILYFFLAVLMDYLVANILLITGLEVLSRNFGQGIFQIYNLIIFFTVFAIIPISLFELINQLWFRSVSGIVLLAILFYYVINIYNLTLLLTFIVALFVLFPAIYRSWKLPGWLWHVCISLLMILVVLIVGIVAIDYLYGSQIFKAQLSNTCAISSQSAFYNMTCVSAGNKSLADYLLVCSFSPSVNIASGYVTFNLRNGSATSYPFKEGTFTPTTEVERLSFKVDGVNHKNESVCLSNSFLKEFITYDEYKSNREKLVTYLLALLNVSLVVLPYFILKIKELSK